MRRMHGFGETPTKVKLQPSYRVVNTTNRRSSNTTWFQIVECEKSIQLSLVKPRVRHYPVTNARIARQH